MRVKCSQRWSRASARRSVADMRASIRLFSCSGDAVVEDALGLHAHDHAVARPLEVLPAVLARQLVDVVVRSLEVEDGDALDLEVVVRIGGVEDGDADARVAAKVLPLRASVRRVEDDVLAVRVDPDDARLRRPVLAQRRHRREALRATESDLCLRQLLHHFTVVGMFAILPALRCASTVRTAAARPFVSSRENRPMWTLWTWSPSAASGPPLKSPACASLIAS